MSEMNVVLARCVLERNDQEYENSTGLAMVKNLGAGTLSTWKTRL